MFASVEEQEVTSVEGTLTFNVQSAHGISKLFYVKKPSETPEYIMLTVM